MKPSSAPVAANAFFRLSMSACSGHAATARFRIEIELAEFLPVAAIGERRQRQIGNA